MARPAAADQTVQDIIYAAVAGVVASTLTAIREAVNAGVATRLKSSGKGRRNGPRAKAPQGRRRLPRKEMTRWVADNRARRVPTFVIEMTGGLDTKKKIVAKYGANVVFEKGKPLPKVSKAA